MKPQPDKPHEITRRAMIYLPPIAAAAAAAAENGSSSASSSDWSNSAGSEGSNGVHRPLPLLAHEGCRERIGPNVCDKFRDIPLQIADFPGMLRPALCTNICTAGHQVPRTCSMELPHVRELLLQGSCSGVLLHAAAALQHDLSLHPAAAAVQVLTSV